MERPLREALTDESPIVLEVEGDAVAFGGGSVMTGYVGPNRMVEEYWDPFPEGVSELRRRRMGVFYVCPMSAVYLHQPVVDRGLYSVLFTRRSIVPEGYVVAGILDALTAGELDDGFVAAAAKQYSRYQQGTTPERALRLFYR